jgi:peptide/nickel transport system permease protein
MIWVHHALRNALIPIVTLIALTIPALIGGAVVTEIVFSWPGMGRLIFDSLMNNDYYLAMAIFLIFGVLVALFNLLAEVAYAFLDPRIRME